jgi:RNA processing factor Prp31
MTIKQTFSSTKAGSLHAALRVPAGQLIPVSKLKQAAKWKRTKRDRLLAAKAALVLRIRYGL